MPVDFFDSSDQEEVNFKIRKEILFLEPKDDVFDHVITLLSDLAFNVTRIKNPQWFKEIVKGSPPFAMVAIDGTGMDPETAMGLLSTMEMTDPSVPLIWLCEPQAEPPAFGDRTPEEVLNTPCSNHLLEAKLLRLLKLRFFPKDIRQIFVDSVSTALEDNFQTKVDAVNSYLKADALALGPVSAMVSFVGENCNGCITVSGAPPFFIASHNRLVQGLEPPPPGEVAGEMCNSITGYFKATLGKYNLTLRHSFPIIVEGHPISLAYGGPGRLALVETVSDGEGDVHVELCLDIFAPLPEEPDDSDMLEDGEINFF